MAATSRHPVDQLFDALMRFGDYPVAVGVIPVPGRIPSTAFFPGGSGLWGTEPDQPFPPMPVRGVMVLGHNFDCEAGFYYSLAHAGENLRGPTWRTIRDVLTRADIAMNQCFFTNAYMGLIAGDKPVGQFPGRNNAEFVRRCRQFLLVQLRVQQPRLVLTLGKEVPPVLAPLSPEVSQNWTDARTLQDIDRLGAALIFPVNFTDVPRATAVVALTHPANRAPNVKRRHYKGHEGDDAEMALLRDALAAEHDG